jgi:hypothetical protein
MWKVVVLIFSQRNNSQERNKCLTAVWCLSDALLCGDALVMSV